MNDSMQEIRRNVCWKLAEVLLHGVSEVSYVRPDFAGGGSSAAAYGSGIRTGSAAGYALRSSTAAAESPWKPRKHLGANLYTPRSLLEEVRRTHVNLD